MAPIAKLLCIVGTLLLGLVAFAWVDFWMITGSPVPLSYVETLDHPVLVKAWDSDGLFLADGRKVMPKGLTEIPVDSKALRHLTRRGVEVGADGSVTGLVDRLRTCGNDPYLQRTDRVDIGLILAFFRIGQSDIKDLPEKRSATVYDFERGIGRPYSSYKLWLRKRGETEPKSLRT